MSFHTFGPALVRDRRGPLAARGARVLDFESQQQLDTYSTGVDPQPQPIATDADGYVLEFKVEGAHKVVWLEVDGLRKPLVAYEALALQAIDFDQAHSILGQSEANAANAASAANQATSIKNDLEQIFLGGTEAVNDAAVATYVDTAGTLTKSVLQSSFALRSLLDARLHGLEEGTHDSAPALNAAADDARNAGVPLYVPSGTYYIDETVNLRYLNVRSDATIIVRHTDAPGVIVGHTSVQRPQLRIRFREVAHTGYSIASMDNLFPAIRVIGLKGSEFSLGRTSYLEFYANDQVSADNSIAYNTINLGRTNVLRVKGVGANGWINENLFLGGSFSRIYIEGHYSHNNNKFIKPAIEGPASYGAILSIQDARNNYFEDVRIEGVVNIEFLGAAANNSVAMLWRGHDDIVGPSAPVKDETGQNFVFTRYQQNHTVHTVARIDSDTQITSTKSEIRGMTTYPTTGSGFKTLSVGAGWSYLADFTIPIVDLRPPDATANQTLSPYAKVRSLLLRSDQAIPRPLIYGYRADGTLIDPAVTPFLSEWGPLSGSAGRYGVAAAVSGVAIRVTDPSVAYLRFVINTASAAEFKHITLSAYLPVGHHPGIVEQARRAAHNRSALT